MILYEHNFSTKCFIFLMHSRESKVKRTSSNNIEADSDIVEGCDKDNWEEYVPTLLEKVSSNRAELRLNGIRTLNHIFGTVFVGDQLERHMNEIVMALSDVLTNYSIPEEYNEACNLIAILAINMGETFDSYASTIFADYLSTLPDLSENEVQLIRMIALISSFINVERSDVINAFMSLLLRKQRNETGYVAELLHSLSIVLSSITEEEFDKYAKQVRDIIDVKLTSQNPEILMPTIELCSVVFDYLRAKDDNAEDESILYASQFSSQYRDRLMACHRGLQTKKTDIKLLKKKADNLLKQFDGEIETLGICLNQQNVEFVGKRKLILIKAIRHLTTVHFDLQMSRNEFIHHFFEFRLLSEHQVVLLKKKYHFQLKRDRDTQIKDREQEINKKRRLKEKIGIDEED